MPRIHFTRALVVLTLIASLTALPATAQAAPRVEDHEGERAGSVSVLGSLINWVTSIWGAGGPTLDPSGHKPPPTLTTEEGTPHDANVRSNERQGADRG